jgi:hypothetical protein
LQNAMRPDPVSVDLFHIGKRLAFGPELHRRLFGAGIGVEWVVRRRSSCRESGIGSPAWAVEAGQKIVTGP